MNYLDVAQLESITPAEFNARKPFPWCNPAALLTAGGFDRLTGNMPDVEQFRPVLVNNESTVKKAATATFSITNRAWLYPLSG